MPLILGLPPPPASPAWNEIFAFTVPMLEEAEGRMHFEVWDYDKIGKDRFIGQVGGGARVVEGQAQILVAGL